MRNNNLNIHPHEHINETRENVVDITPRIIDINPSDSDAVREARMSLMVGACMVSGSLVIADMVNDKQVSEAVVAGTGTTVVLGLAYFMQPYLSRTRIGMKIEKWAIPRQEEITRKQTENKIHKEKLMHEKDLKNSIKKNTRKIFGNKAKLFY